MMQIESGVKNEETSRLVGDDALDPARAVGDDPCPHGGTGRRSSGGGSGRSR